MIKDNLLPVTVYLAPPSTQDEAIQRVAELCSESVIGLTGAVFLNLRQFAAAMTACRLNCTADIMMDNGRVKTYKGVVIDTQGFEYKFILNTIGDYYLQVVNMKMTKVGPKADPEAVKAVTETLKEDTS